MSARDWVEIAALLVLLAISTPILGFVGHQYISAAVGMALAVAFMRGLIRRRQTTLGSFWVDTVRSTTRVLIPISFVFAVVFMTQGAIQNFHASKTVTTVAVQS